MTGERAETDLRRIRALAVHTTDVLDALEARERTDNQVVLRTLPPFSGRMRARLHVVGGDGTAGTGAVHLHPGVFVHQPPAYPRVDDTADELRAAGEYDVETHRERHEQTVEAWREAVRSCLRTEVTVSDPSWDAEATLRVSYLG